MTSLDELSSVLESLLVYGLPVVIGGDINIHVEDPTDNIAANYLDLPSSMDIAQHVAGCTHDFGITLDQIIAPIDFRIGGISVDPSTGHNV